VEETRNVAACAFPEAAQRNAGRLRLSINGEYIRPGRQTHRLPAGASNRHTRSMTGPAGYFFSFAKDGLHPREETVGMHPVLPPRLTANGTRSGCTPDPLFCECESLPYNPGHLMVFPAATWWISAS